MRSLRCRSRASSSSCRASEVDALSTYARLARLRYEGGYTSYIEVLDAERSLFNAQLSYTQTNGVVYDSVVALYKAMGGGWVVTAEQMTHKDRMRHRQPGNRASSTAASRPCGAVGCGAAAMTEAPQPCNPRAASSPATNAICCSANVRCRPTACCAAAAVARNCPATIPTA